MEWLRKLTRQITPDPTPDHLYDQPLKRYKICSEPLRVHFAPLRHKFFAWLIDGLLLTGLFALLHIHWGFWFLCAILYFSGLECSPLEGSIGEYLVGIQIRHRTGRPAGLKHIIARNTAYVLTLGLSSFSSLFSRKGRGLHDQIGHTVSIETSPK